MELKGLTKDVKNSFFTVQASLGKMKVCDSKAVLLVGIKHIRYRWKGNQRSLIFKCKKQVL